MAEERPEGTLLLLVETSPTAPGLSKFAGPLEIPIDRLQGELQSFVDKVLTAVGSIRTMAENFELDEVGVDAVFTAEGGFALVAKAGVEGAVRLKFRRVRPRP